MNTEGLPVKPPFRLLNVHRYLAIRPQAVALVFGFRSF